MPKSDSKHGKDELLRILDAHGKQFLGSFGTSQIGSKRKDSPGLGGGQKKRLKKHIQEGSSSSSESEPEWNGFSHSLLTHGEGSTTPGEHSHSGDQTTQTRLPSVVVFTNSSSKSEQSNANANRAQMKAFMSSKVSKVMNAVSQDEDQEASQAEDELELTNVQNDALLHRLVHTQILSGSLKSELDLTPAQRKKALAGRVLEVAGKAKLGKGETSVRATERNRAAKHVRDGLLEKQKERTQKALDEAKHMGNYHPALKQVYETPKSTNRKRQRGLKLGVGSFGGGVLKLSQKEAASAQGILGRSQGKRKR